MAEMSTIDVKRSAITDISASMQAAAAGGDTFPVNDGTLFMMNNGDASSHTATFATAAANVSVDGFGSLPNAALTLVVAAGDIGMIYVPPLSHGTAGRATVTYDDVTTVTVGAFKSSEAV